MYNSTFSYGGFGEKPMKRHLTKSKRKIENQNPGKKL